MTKNNTNAAVEEGRADLFNVSWRQGSRQLRVVWDKVIVGNQRNPPSGKFKRDWRRVVRLDGREIGEVFECGDEWCASGCPGQFPTMTAAAEALARVAWDLE